MGKKICEKNRRKRKEKLKINKMSKIYLRQVIF